MCDLTLLYHVLCTNTLISYIICYALRIITTVCYACIMQLVLLHVERKSSVKLYLCVHVCACVWVHACVCVGALVAHRLGSWACNPRVSGSNPTRAGGKKDLLFHLVPPAHPSVKRVPGWPCAGVDNHHWLWEWLWPFRGVWGCTQLCLSQSVPSRSEAPAVLDSLHARPKTEVASEVLWKQKNQGIITLREMAHPFVHFLLLCYPLSRCSHHWWNVCNSFPHSAHNRRHQATRLERMLFS